MKRKITTVQAFVEGNAFVKINSKNGFEDFCDKIIEKNSDVMVEVPDSYSFEFKPKEFIAVFDKQSNKIKVAIREFFDYVYISQPITRIDKTKSYWIEV